MILVLGFKSSRTCAAADRIAVTGDMGHHLHPGHRRRRQGVGWGWIAPAWPFHPLPRRRTGLPTANILRFLHGGWFPAGCRDGRLRAHDHLETRPPAALDRLRRTPGQLVLSRMPSPRRCDAGGRHLGFRQRQPPQGAPARPLQQPTHNKVLHERVVLVSAELLHAPRAGYIDRVEARQLKENFWSVVIQHRFPTSPHPGRPVALRRCRPGLQPARNLHHRPAVTALGFEMAFWR